MLKHIDDRRRAAWRHPLPVAPRVDLFDQLRLNPDVNICGFSVHAKGSNRKGAEIQLASRIRPMRGESRRYGLNGPKCSAADPRDRCWLRYCCHRPHQGGNPADDGPAASQVHKADPWATVMASDHGNDQRCQVDAEHEAQHEPEADQIADAIDKAFHRLLSVEAREVPVAMSER